jgi:threonine dehydrogenase-like Zn-dependent dehydrogenase
MASCLDRVAAGKIDVAGFVTARFPVSLAAEAFEEYEAHPGKILRIVIESGG